MGQICGRQNTAFLDYGSLRSHNEKYSISNQGGRGKETGEKRGGEEGEGGQEEGGEAAELGTLAIF